MRGPAGAPRSFCFNAVCTTRNTSCRGSELSRETCTTPLSRHRSCCFQARPTRGSSDSAAGASIGEKRWICSNHAALANAVINAAAHVQPRRATHWSPRAAARGSFYTLSQHFPPPQYHNITHTSGDTLKRTMMHYCNEKRHVQGPEVPLNQCVGGNSTDLLKTFDVPAVFGC